MKYPLTPEAKVVASHLVEAWNSGEIDQIFELVDVTAGNVNRREYNSGLGVPGEFEIPQMGVVRELAVYGLVSLRVLGNNIKNTLLQELRNAVATDFEVSDYFITMNAVGNIIINSTTGPVAGMGIGNAPIHQTVEQLSTDLAGRLGDDFLQTQTHLREAIDALSESAEADQQSKLGKVVSELGRCLQHGANTAGVMGAIRVVAAFLG